MTTVVGLLVVAAFLVAAVVGARAAYTGRPYRLDGELQHMHRSEP